MSRGGGENTVESRKLKVESQPERGRIQRPEKLARTRKRGVFTTEGTEMGRRGGEEDTVESRKSRPGRDLRSRATRDLRSRNLCDLRLKVEGQPKPRKIRRPGKLPDRVGAGGAGADAEHAEITGRCGLRCGAAEMEAQYQTLCYHVGTILVKE